RGRITAICAHDLAGPPDLVERQRVEWMNDGNLSRIGLVVRIEHVITCQSSYGETGTRLTAGSRQVRPNSLYFRPRPKIRHMSCGNAGPSLRRDARSDGAAVCRRQTRQFPDVAFDPTTPRRSRNASHHPADALRQSRA